MPYRQLLIDSGFQPTRRGPWSVCGKTSRQQGWKLHVSTVPVEAEVLLGRVVPYFQRRGTKFKVLSGLSELLMQSEGGLGPTQVGKFMTVYPENDEDCCELADGLMDMTRDLQGPPVLTDLHLGANVYARYGSFSPLMSRDRFGHVMAQLQLPDGSLIPDDYSVPYEIPPGIAHPFGDRVKQRRQIDIEQEGAVFGPGYFILGTLRSKPVGSVFLALDVRDRENVTSWIIKEGRRHCQADGAGRDAVTRLLREKCLLRRFAGRVRLPRVREDFEVEGNHYLVLEHLPGRTLATESATPWSRRNDLEQRQLLGLLADLVDQVQGLHSEGFAHRDLTPNNIWITEDDDIVLLDLELAHPLVSAEPPLTLGTPGFMSPNQLARQAPQLEDDIYALGCVMIMAVAAVDPRYVLHVGEEALAKVLTGLCGVERPFADLIARCVEPDPAARPTLEALRTGLDPLMASASAGPLRLPTPWNAPDTLDDRCAELLAGVPMGLMSAVRRDPETGLWLSESLDHANHVSATEGSFSLYRSASRGVAGVLLSVARLKQAGIDISTCRDQAESAVDWLLDHQPTPDDQLPGLHFGEAGVAVAIAEAVHAGLIEAGPWLKPYLAEALSGPLDWPDMTHGAAGQGIAALCCGDLLGISEARDAASACAEYLVSQQDTDGGWTLPEGVETLRGVRYTGFAHGVAGMVYFLTVSAHRTDDEKARDAALRGLEWLMESAIPGPGNALCWSVKSDDEEQWHWWCHGGPGIALSFLKAYEVWGDSRHGEVAERALSVHPVDIRYPNLSQCHGLSGLGEAYLEAHRVLGQPSWKSRASHIASTLCQLARRDPKDGVSWLVENAHSPTADLMVGGAGIAHYLSRYSGLGDSGPPLLPGASQAIEPVPVAPSTLKVDH